jgi:hypothetical protein
VCPFVERHKVQIKEGIWQAAKFQGYIYKLPPGSDPRYIDPINYPSCHTIAPLIQLPTSNVECPCVIFAYKPDKDTSTYDILKMASHFDSGVNSQCIVSTKYTNQKTQKKKEQ